MRRALVLALGLAVGLAGALGTGACGGPPTCPVTPVSGAERGAPFLWRVERAGSAPLWLLGTIHDAGIDAVPKAALDALDAAPRVVTELGAGKPDSELLRSYARRKSGPGIDHELSTDDWYDLRDALRGVIREDDLRRAEPWYAMTLLTTHSAPSPGPSMDSQLAERARARGKPVEALERWEDQLALLRSVVQLSDLEEAIRARKTMRCDLARLQAAYAAGDTATLTALLVVPRTSEVMLYARNRQWLPVLEAHAERDGAFVAVGLGHMLGEQGLPVLLERAGYRVERVPAR
jgi:uncharacterized protein